MSAAYIVKSLVDIGRDVEADFAQSEPEDPESLAFILAAIRDCRADLAAFYANVERELISTTGQKRFTVEHLGEINVRRRTKRTSWRHDELVPAVVARIVDESETLFDTETGELHPPAVIGQNVASRLRDCVSFGAGKVTGLRALGLQPDEFCNETADGYSVELPPRDRVTRPGEAGLG